MTTHARLLSAILLFLTGAAAAQSDTADHRHIELQYGFDIEYDGKLYPVSINYLTSRIHGTRFGADDPLVMEWTNREVSAEGLPFTLAFERKIGWVETYNGERTVGAKALGVAGVRGKREGPFYFSNDFRWFDINFCTPDTDECTGYKPRFGREPTAFLYRNKPANIDADRPSNIDEGFFEYIDFSFTVPRDLAQKHFSGQRRQSFSFRNLKLTPVIAAEGAHPEGEPSR